MIDNKEDWEREEEIKEDHRNSSKKISKVEEGVWKSGVEEDANKKSLGLCYRSQRDI